MLNFNQKSTLANIPLDKIFLGLAAIVAALGYGYALTQSPRLLLLVGIPVAVLVVVATCRWPQVAAVVLLATLWGFLSDALVKFQNLPSPVYLLTALLIGALVVQRFGRQRIPLVYSPMNWLMLAWLFILVMGLWYATSFNVVVGRLTEFCRNLIFYVILINLISTRTAFVRAMWLLLVVGALLGSLTVYQEATHNYRNNYGGLARMEVAHIADGLHNRPRAAGTTSEPLAYGQQLIVLVPIGLWGMMRARNLFSKIFATYATAICIAGIGLTFSRGTYIALIVALIAFAIYIKLNLRQLLVVIPILSVLIWLAPSDFTARYNTIGELAPGDKGVYVDKSTLTRSVEMRMAWYMFLDNPLVGVGAGNYGGLYPSYIRREGAPVDDQFGNPHNMYLEVAAEEGMVGIAVFSAILLLAIVQLVSATRLFKIAGDRVMSTLAASLAIAFLGYCMTALFFQASYPRFLWLQIAMSTAMLVIAQRQTQDVAQEKQLAAPEPQALVSTPQPAVGH